MDSTQEYGGLFTRKVEVRLSFRDPAGFVFRSDERIFRCVLPHAADNLRTFLQSGIATAWMAERILAPTSIASDSSTTQIPSNLADQWQAGAILLEHDPIRFTNYPYEWPPEMLHAAAELTLRLACESLAAGFDLKDATPYNIMFDGPRPVFIDVLSFERRDELALLWLPYAQFVRTFIYPLLAARYFGVRVDELLLVHRDGLEPERMFRLCSWWRRWLPPFLGSVTIPAILARRQDQPSVSTHRGKDPDEAKFVLERWFRRASRLLERMPARREARHDATRYMDCECIYSSSEWVEKERAVTRALDGYRPSCVLDIGCNTGHFSELAARKGSRVVAIDRDPAAVGALWRSATTAALPILPLVIDIARPPGGCGWSNAEFPPFLDRARGHFDCVLMLAMLHHVLVNERVPLASVFDLAASLTTRLLIVEYVDPSDRQFQRVARGRDALHRDLTPNSFEEAARRRFKIVDRSDVTPTRRIYTLERGSA